MSKSKKQVPATDEKKIQELTVSKECLNNAMAIICNAEVMGAQCAIVNTTLTWLKNFRDEIVKDLEALTPATDFKIDPKKA